MLCYDTLICKAKIFLADYSHLKVKISVEFNESKFLLLFIWIIWISSQFLWTSLFKIYCWFEEEPGLHCNNAASNVTCASASSCRCCSNFEIWASISPLYQSSQSPRTWRVWDAAATRAQSSSARVHFEQFRIVKRQSDRARRTPPQLPSKWALRALQHR